MLVYLLFIIGFFILVKGADLFVDGASSVAHKLKIPNIVIGLTIVAFGTSAPELFVNIFASFKGTADIAIGNILGSNICNVFLILGVASSIRPLVAQNNTIWKEIPLSLLAALVLGFLANDVLIDGGTSSVLTRIDGFILLSFFSIFLYYILEISRSGKSDFSGAKSLSLSRSIVYLIIGFIGLVLGSQWIVDGAVSLATKFNVSQSLIGLTIIGIGTSLPELVTSAVAAYKGQSAIALGNVIGSNIFNIFLILGISSTIHPLPFQPHFNFDMIMVIAASLIVFITMFVGQKRIIERWQGITLVLIYLGYLVFVIHRG